MNVWLYIFIISIPVIIGILFLVSFFMINDKEQYRVARVLGFFICSPDSIITFIIIFALMCFTIVVLQLLAYSDLYAKSESCMPILYYFGVNTDDCKQVIARTARIQSQLSEIRSTINDLNQYKTARDRGTSAGKEQFVGGRYSMPSYTNVTTRFSHIMDELKNAYRWYVKKMIIYMIKMYRDIILPWSRIR